MTTEIVAGTLTVTHQEVLTLLDAEGNEHAGTRINEFAIVSCTTKLELIVPVTDTEIGLLSFAVNTNTAVQAPAFTTGYVGGHHDENDVRYLRITNLDDTDAVTLTFRDAADNEFSVRLEQGQSFIFVADNAAGLAATMSAATGAAGALQNLSDITAARATAGECDLEIYMVAS